MNILLKMRKAKKWILTNEQINVINSIPYNKIHTEKLKRIVTIYYINGIDFNVLQNNWNDILNLPSRDSSSLLSFITKYGDEWGNKLYNKKNKECTKTREDYIEEFGIEKAIDLLHKRGASLEIYKKRYGEIDAIIKWNAYCKKRANTYKNRRGTYIKRNLEWFQNKYGDKEGYKIWDHKRKKQAYKVSKQYYIDTYGKDIGLQKLKKCKSRGIEFYIKKYGNEIGREKYTSMLKKRIKQLKTRKNYSKWATEICEHIKKEISDLHFYGNNEMIWELSEKYKILLKQKIISPDLFYRGKIIEFQGDIFHGNINLYELNDRPHPFNNKTVEELLYIDKIRFDYYKEKGYEVMEIWENDWKEDKIGVLKKCQIFLK